MHIENKRPGFIKEIQRLRIQKRKAQTGGKNRAKEQDTKGENTRAKLKKKCKGHATVPFFISKHKTENFLKLSREGHYGTKSGLWSQLTSASGGDFENKKDLCLWNGTGLQSYFLTEMNDFSD